MLCVRKVHRAHKIDFADLPSMVGVKKSFALRDHRLVMPGCATDRQCSPSVLASSNGPGELPAADFCSLVETSREAGGPVRRPLRPQTDPSVVIGTRQLKDDVVLPDAH